MKNARFWLALALACSSEDGAIHPNPDGPAPIECEEDENVNADSAQALDLGGKAVEGFICPVGDADFYEFASGTGLVLIDVGNDVPLSTVDLSYTLLGTTGQTVAAPPSGETDLPPVADEDGSDGITSLSRHHKLPEGDAFLVARDLGDNEQDARNPYSVTLSAATDPDKNEPNDTPTTATPTTATASGFIAYYGDIDMYAVTLSATSLLRIGLSATGIGTGLTLRWTDEAGAQVFELEDPNGALAEAGYETLRAIPNAGTHIIHVRAWDRVSEDFDTPYTLTLSTETEPDPNEGETRNDLPATATPLFGGAPFTGTGSTTDAVSDGYLASAGDQDWYVIETTSRAIVEVTLDGPDTLEMSLQLMTPDDITPCAADEDCVLLADTCDKEDQGWQCLSNVCNLETNHCQGSGICLPESLCAVPHFTRTVAGGTELRTAQPVLSAGRHYVVVSDQGNDEWSSSPYSLSVTVRADLDVSESDNDYDPYPLEDTPPERSLPLSRSLALGTTRTGYISYEADYDHYRLENLPCCDSTCVEECGGEADVCSLVVEFGTDSGDVDMVWEFFNGTEDGVGGGDAITLADQPDGRLDGSDCFIYSRFIVVNSGETFFVRVRDEGADSWDADQQYYIRFVGVAQGCPSGCDADCTKFCGAACGGSESSPGGDATGCCVWTPGSPSTCSVSPDTGTGVLDGGFSVDSGTVLDSGLSSDM